MLVLVPAFESSSRSPFRIDRHGAILRFTPLDPEQSNGPQAPVSAAPKHPQGTVLEAREGKLVVAFKEADMWVLGDGEYR